MGWFSWFGGKDKAAAAKPPAAAFQPKRSADQADSQFGEPGTDARSRRNERREHLYGVVRDCMVRAEVLSASYKFKVLSLDQRGQQFLVMVDLAAHVPHDAARLAGIEQQVIELARKRFDITVTAVYWRVVLVASSEGAALARPAVQTPAAAPVPPAKPTGFDPLEAHEMAAFQQALAAARRPPTPRAPSGFADTVAADPQDLAEDERPPALSATQYGGLH